MPAITDRSSKAPLLKTGKLNHGTLGCRDLAKTRRFYEEVLGLECVQTSPISLMVRKGTEHVYAVVEVPGAPNKNMEMINHNGFEVDTHEEVDAAYQAILSIKDEWGLLRVMPPKTLHGDHTFYFIDFDGNWWEVVSVRKGGYVADFADKGWDLTGRHELAELMTSRKDKLMHLHDPEVREFIRANANGSATATEK
jgi:catechol 2,3-dioxygenase-like lactoylglutathione lyase family enzyme